MTILRYVVLLCRGANIEETTCLHADGRVRRLHADLSVRKWMGRGETCAVSHQERATLAIRLICVVSPKKGTGRENLRHLYISGWTVVERGRKVFLEWSINNIVLVSQTSMLLSSLL